MGFEVLKKTSASAKRYDADKVYLQSPAKKTRIWYRVVIGMQVWSRLAWPEPDAVVAWGTGEDKGRVRIAPAGPREASTTEVKLYRDAMRRCSLGPLPTDAARIETSGPVSYQVKRIDDAAVLFLELPEGFFREAAGQ